MDEGGGREGMREKVGCRDASESRYYNEKKTYIVERRQRSVISEDGKNKKISRGGNVWGFGKKGRRFDAHSSFFTHMVRSVHRVFLGVLNKRKFT